MTNTKSHTLRWIALFTIEQNLYKPYAWGGDNPLIGFDCSGLMNESFKSVGMMKNDEDYGAHDLRYVKFKDKPSLERNQIKPGCLLFFENASGRIFHVEMVWDVVGDMILTIGASGGTHETTSLQQAIKQDAYVKIRPREKYSMAIDPFGNGV